MPKIYAKTMLMLVAALCLGAGAAWAVTDFSAMTTEEMATRRGTMQQTESAEHQAFQEEWQKRLNKMSPEDRQKYMGRPEAAPEPEKNQERLKEKVKREKRDKRDKEMPTPQNRGMERRDELGLGGQPGRPEQTPAAPPNRGMGKGR